MNVNNVFPSRYLKVEDVGTKRYTLTIRDVIVEKLGGNDGDTKPVIYFTKTEKGLCCNKTNFFIIANLYGDETDDWIGKPITIYAGWTQFQGKRCQGLMVEQQVPPAYSARPQAHVSSGTGNGNGRPDPLPPRPAPVPVAAPAPIAEHGDQWEGQPGDGEEDGEPIPF